MGRWWRGVGGGEVQGVDLGFERSDSTLVVREDRAVASHEGQRGGRRRRDGDGLGRGGVFEVGDAILDLGESTAEQRPDEG